jgi:hypothetical protein
VIVLKTIKLNRRVLMHRTIRIDAEVWRFLQAKAQPFEDSPNSVLRRELGLDNGISRPNTKQRQRQALSKLSPTIHDGKFRLEFDSGKYKEFKLPEKKIGQHISSFFSEVNLFIRQADGTEGQVAGIRYFLHKAGYYVRGPKK